MLSSIGACIGVIIGSKCSSGPVHLNIDPYCGYLPDCYMNAANLGNLEHMSCYRAENGLPGTYIYMICDCNIRDSLFINIISKVL